MPDLRRGSLVWLWLSVVVIALDQVTKWIAVDTLQMYQQVPIIDGLFSFTLAYNTGAAFSFLADASGWQRWLFAGIAVVVSVVLCVWLARLDRARSLLRNSALPLTQIALATGFANSSHFSRAYSAQFGQAPSRYR